jgi:hypothetical protein
MTEHLPECWAKHESDPEAWCICDELRACEQRVLIDTATRHLAVIKMIGLGILQTRADARWIAAKEALEGVLHDEPCDCEPCKAITRALAELWTIGNVER